MRHRLSVILSLAICSPLEGADFSTLRGDLFRDTGRISGVRIPEGDVRYQAIEKLRQEASPQAVRMLGEFLITHDVDRKLKTHALAALGEIGAIEAVDAVARFERWSRRRYTSPPPFQFGEQDDAAVCFAPRKVTPQAQATDPQGRQWAVFRWDRFGAPALWLAMPERKGEWGNPIYLDSLKSFSLENTNDDTFRLEVSESMVRVSHDAQTREIARRALADDADKDGLADLIENRLGTNPRKADSAVVYERRRVRSENRVTHACHGGDVRLGGAPGWQRPRDRFEESPWQMARCLLPDHWDRLGVG